MKKWIALSGCLLIVSALFAQDNKDRSIPAGPSIWGTTGLIAMPTPTLMQDGTIMAGANYLPWEYFKESAVWENELGLVNSGNYYFNAAFLPFWEVQLRFTLMKLRDPENPKYKGKWNQDRSISTKFRVLKEKGLYRPAIAVGMEDITFNWPLGGNNYFTRGYVSVAKHWDVKVGTIGATANVVVARGKQVFSQVGVQFAPSVLFGQPVRGLSAMAEYDGHGFNAGARWLLFNHVSLMAATYHFNSVTAGVAFYIDLY